MSYKKKLIVENHNTEVVVLGNSHTFFGINPEESEFKMINVANKGRKLETDYLLMKRYAENFKGINFIIIPISHFTLLSKGLSIQEKRLYYNFYNLKGYNQGLLKNSLILNQPFRELVNNSIFNLNYKKKISNLGWRANKTIYKKDSILIAKKIEEMEGDYGARKKNIIYNEKILNNIIELNSSINSKLVFIIPPYHPDYYDNSNTEYYKQIIKILTQVEKNNDKVFFINSKKLKIKQDKCFENVDHLNVEGASFFTKKLDSILKIHS